MAVREFTDSRGVEWRAWDVTAEHIHPVTRSEDYMANLQDGWLAFESPTEKRRLEAPYPSEWTTLSLPALEALCARAAPVVRRGLSSPAASLQAVRAVETEVQAMEASHAQITFRSPGGREWVVRIHESLDHAGHGQSVLRFTAGDVVVDLPRWPSTWQSSTVAQFALMMLDAIPPIRRKQGEGPQRRLSDRAAPHHSGGAGTTQPAR